MEAITARLGVYRIASARRFPNHRHAYSHVGVVLSGGGRHVIAGEIRAVTAGDSYYIPAGVEHYFVTDPGPPTVLLEATIIPPTRRSGALAIPRLVPAEPSPAILGLERRRSKRRSTAGRKRPAR